MPEDYLDFDLTLDARGNNAWDLAVRSPAG